MYGTRLPTIIDHWGYNSNGVATIVVVWHGGGSLLEAATGRGASSARGDKRGDASTARASDTGRKGGVRRSIMRADRLGGSSGGAWRSSPPRKRRRPGSPNSPSIKGTVRLQVSRGVVVPVSQCECEACD